MSELTPETNRDAPPNSVTAVETPETPGTNYAYIDRTRPEVKEAKVTEASHAELNPAYYPRELKPEAQWNEAEKEGADTPGGNEVEARSIASQVAAGDAEVKQDEKGKVTVEGAKPFVPLGPGESEESTSEEAAQERKRRTEELAQRDIKAAEERGEEPPVIKPEPTTETEKVRRKRQAS